MRALIQRVSLASVKIEDKETRSIGRGLLVLLGVAPGDTEAGASRLADKILSLRLLKTAMPALNGWSKTVKDWVSINYE